MFSDNCITKVNIKGGSRIVSKVYAQKILVVLYVKEILIPKNILLFVKYYKIASQKKQLSTLIILQEILISKMTLFPHMRSFSRSGMNFWQKPQKRLQAYKGFILGPYTPRPTPIGHQTWGAKDMTIIKCFYWDYNFNYFCFINFSRDFNN